MVIVFGAWGKLFGADEGEIKFRAITYSFFVYIIPVSWFLNHVLNRKFRLEIRLVPWHLESFIFTLTKP